MPAPKGITFKHRKRRIINFCSNDYLGLATDKQVIAATVKAAKKWGVGAGASHLVSGHKKIHRKLEAELANWLGFPKVLLFSCGYMANLAVLSTLAGKDDLIVQDKLNHASLVDGALLSNAKHKRFLHLNRQSLLQQLANSAHYRHRWLVTDGVFSMDGDAAPLKKWQKICKKHRASLIIDDAHGIGVRGKQGRGSIAVAKLEPKNIGAVIGTFSKAFGGYGAFVGCDTTTADYLFQFAKTYRYTTATPPMLAAGNLCALELIKHSDKRKKLAANIAYFKRCCRQLGIDVGNHHTPIIPLIVGNNEKALQLGKKLFEQGFHVGSIRPPSVPHNSARLRITLSAMHQKHMLDALLDAIYPHLKRPSS